MPHPPTQLQGITDLTLLADIKPGLIEGIFDSRSYTWRLGRVLGLLDAARHANRESDLLPNPIIDGVARLRGVHFFRFAILPPGRQLLLNVTFDGGWEPYMRLIWGPLGTMLDLIFCHCDGYPQAALSSYDEYIRWVRNHEVPSQFFYADSGGSVADRAYLNQLERQQRAGGDRPSADLRAVQTALGILPPPQPSLAAVTGALRSLKGLCGLNSLFAMPPAGPATSAPGGDRSVLLRFAQEYLSDLRDWYALGLFDPGQRFDALRSPFEPERQWLMATRWKRPDKRDLLPKFDRTLLQAAILDSPKATDGRYVRGALVLVRVINPGDARAWLKSSATPAGSPPVSLISHGGTFELRGADVMCTVAITYTGLKALGVHEDYLKSLPAEFTQGMEARAGILGDLRCNHPQQWTRPLAWRPGAGLPIAPIDLPQVHLVFQLRTAEVDDDAKADRSKLLDRLREWIDQKLCAAIEVLAVEPAWSRPKQTSEPAARDHFGYADGFSQPTLLPSAGSLFWGDAVKAGEILLGRVNDRGDGPLDMPEAKPVSPPWLDDGTFLVVRKIRKFVDRFDGVVKNAAEALLAAQGATSLDQARERVRAKLMGRGSDGVPLVEQRGDGFNDFDYRHDTDGAQCPFASHVRRANPRAALPGMRPPRIMRRGMGYGRPPPDEPAKPSDPPGHDAEECGTLFMAYNASIAEQFEVIQRWLTGGNSSGVSSSQADPFLGVPKAGEPVVFRCALGDKVMRVDLGDQPISRLEWGLYAFVPSMTRLQELEAQTKPLAASKGPPGALPAPAEKTNQQVKTTFEDDLSRRARWDMVRGRGGVERIDTSVMVGGYAPVLKVLKDLGATYSASGYGTCMRDTLGPSPFGEDEVGPHKGHERPFVSKVKDAVNAAVSEQQAYDTAYGFTATGLDNQLRNSRALGLPGASVDIIDLGNNLVAHLCQEWFGVVFDDLTEIGGIDPQAKRVRCPGHFLVMARNVFSADPNGTVKGLASAQKKELKEAVKAWVNNAPKVTHAPVMKAVLKAMDEGGLKADKDADEWHGTVANVMLGLPATLLGTWGKVVLRAWVPDRRLWQFQHALGQLSNGSANCVDASRVLRAALITTMAADPVADGIWRTAVKRDELYGVEVGDKVWLGLGAAIADRPGDLQAAEDLLFGGAFDANSDRHSTHACPGRGMAVGALLGALAALLMAGQWSTTASPITLSLRPRLP